ncbi:ubiquinol-cytochrome C chaperone family protein [Sphingomonas sp. BK235]|uniref:ubiquinol-cytochrome C chaperone family protein n=1 Tax=Sphingomonas sp. BK235 TaxID=2512131 RepID=UPI00105022C7|nr:ubiquinol-cytochrome C chaperone family protein [Sphingomonas sp. BK235]TCP35636.1 cytochrome b pre-mRNA-processing protein 3 [Sphingomonas sp. BK235]
MGWLSGWLRPRGSRDEALPLYDAVVARARAPHWYLDGAVPDTLDGRFDMVAAVLAMVLLRLEQMRDATDASIRLTERFVDDMDAQVRQIGFGDMVVGKHVGRMMGMLGGRLGAYRDGLAATDPAALDAALVRNLYRGSAPDQAALTHVRQQLIAVRAALDGLNLGEMMKGRLA